MPTINFPLSPALNDEYSFQGKTWRYDGSSWLLISTPLTIRVDAAFEKANTVSASVFPFIDFGYVYESTGPAPAEFDCGTL